MSKISPETIKRLEENLRAWKAKVETANFDVVISIHQDRIEEIGMALGCDMPETNPYEKGTIEYGIYKLRKEHEEFRRLLSDLIDKADIEAAHGPTCYSATEKCECGLNELLTEGRKLINLKS